MLTTAHVVELDNMWRKVHWSDCTKNELSDLNVKHYMWQKCNKAKSPAMTAVGAEYRARKPAPRDIAYNQSYNGMVEISVFQPCSPGPTVLHDSGSSLLPHT